LLYVPLDRSHLVVVRGLSRFRKPRDSGMKRARGPRGSRGGRSNLFRGRARPPVGANPGTHRGGSPGATGTYSRVGPGGSVGKPAHRAGGGVRGAARTHSEAGPAPPQRVGGAAGKYSRAWARRPARRIYRTDLHMTTQAHREGKLFKTNFKQTWI